MYCITIDDKVIKRYPFKLQCICWLYLKGWIHSGYGDFYDNNKYYFIVNPLCPDAKVKIVKEDTIDKGTL